MIPHCLFHGFHQIQHIVVGNVFIVVCILLMGTAPFLLLLYLFGKFYCIVKKYVPCNCVSKSKK